MKLEEIKDMTLQEICNELDRKNKIVKSLVAENKKLEKQIKNLTVQIPNPEKDDILARLLDAARRCVDLDGKIRTLSTQLKEANERIDFLTKENELLQNKDTNERKR